MSDLLKVKPHGKRTDLTPGLERIVRLLQGRATLFVISDFIQDRSPEFRSAIGRCARAHDVIAVRLSSRGTDELPNVGWVEMTDPETGRRVVIDSGSRRVRTHYRHSVHVAHAEMASVLTEAGVELIEVNTAADPLASLAEFFRRRQRTPR